MVPVKISAMWKVHGAAPLAALGRVCAKTPISENFGRMPDPFPYLRSSISGPSIGSILLNQTGFASFRTNSAHCRCPCQRDSDADFLRDRTSHCRPSPRALDPCVTHHRSHLKRNSCPATEMLIGSKFNSGFGGENAPCPVRFIGQAQFGVYTSKEGEL